MEILWFCILTMIAVHFTKPTFMDSRTIFNRLIIFGFVVLVGYSLAKAIYSNSTMGILLALTGLGAVIYFLYLVAKANYEMRKENINADSN